MRRLITSTLLALLATMIALQASAVIAGEPACCEPIQTGCLIGSPRPQDEVWLLSTRGLGCPSKDWSPYVAKYEECSWRGGALTELVTAVTPDTIVVLYIHGNRVTPSQAKELGWAAYDGIARSAREDQRLVFVIWSWPSEGDRRPIKGTRENLDRAETDAIYVSQFLEQLPLDARIGVFGFSLGGKIITGGLSNLAESDPAGARVRSIQVVLHSPAVSNCWLYDGSVHGSYGLAADRTLLMYNPCDPALQRFRFADRCTRPEALGYTGLGNPSGLAGDGIFEQQNVSGTIGRSHSSYDYLHSPSLMDATRRVVLFE